MCQVMLLEDGTWNKRTLTLALADWGWLPDNDHPHHDRGLTDVVGDILERNAGVLFKREPPLAGPMEYTLVDAARDTLPSHFQEQGWTLGPPQRVKPSRTAWERLGEGF